MLATPEDSSSMSHPGVRTKVLDKLVEGLGNLIFKHFNGRGVEIRTQRVQNKYGNLKGSSFFGGGAGTT